MSNNAKLIRYKMLKKLLEKENNKQNNNKLINNKLINKKDDIIKIIIYTFELNMNSGGIVALYYLAKLINIIIERDNLNIKVMLYISDKSNNFIENIFCNNFANKFDVDENSIVIYPEIISGNPLKAKYIVRWILGELGMNIYTDIYKTWEKQNMVYHWEFVNKNNYRYFSCPYINTIFKIENQNERNDTCFLIKKGNYIHKNINFFHPDDSINIEYMSLEEINKCFNRCKYFYCYDPYTFYIIYSIICGCIPIIYPIDNITKDEYITNTIIKNIKKYAISYNNNNEEIEYAKNIINESAKELIDIDKNNLENTELLLKDLLKYKENYNDNNYINNNFGTVENNYY